MRNKMSLQNDRIDARSFTLGIRVGIMEFSRFACKTIIVNMMNDTPVDNLAESLKTDFGISSAAHLMAIYSLKGIVDRGRNPTGVEWFYTPGGTGAAELDPQEATGMIRRMRGVLGLRSAEVDSRSLLFGFGVGVMAFSSRIGEPAIVPIFPPDILANADDMTRGDVQISTTCIAIMNQTTHAFKHETEALFSNSRDT